MATALLSGPLRTVTAHLCGDKQRAVFTLADGVLTITLPLEATPELALRQLVMHLSQGGAAIVRVLEAPGPTASEHAQAVKGGLASAARRRGV